MDSSIAMPPSVKTLLYFKKPFLCTHILDMTVHAPTQFPHLTEGVCYDVELMLTQYAPHAQYFTCMCHKRFQSVK
jgi:hypothetical protein